MFAQKISQRPVDSLQPPKAALIVVCLVRHVLEPFSLRLPRNLRWWSDAAYPEASATEECGGKSMWH